MKITIIWLFAKLSVEKLKRDVHINIPMGVDLLKSIVRLMIRSMREV